MPMKIIGTVSHGACVRLSEEELGKAVKEVRAELTRLEDEYGYIGDCDWTPVPPATFNALLAKLGVMPSEIEVWDHEIGYRKPEPEELAAEFLSELYERLEEYDYFGVLLNGAWWMGGDSEHDTVKLKCRGCCEKDWRKREWVINTEDHRCPVCKGEMTQEEYEEWKWGPWGDEEAEEEEAAVA
jgi:hypothetical protein